MLKRTGKYDSRTLKKTRPGPPGKFKIRWGRLGLLLLAVLAVFGLVGLLAIKKEVVEDETDSRDLTCLSRCAVNRIGDAEIGYVPRESPVTLDIEPITFSYDGNRIDVTIPRDYRGEPAVGPSALIDYDSLRVLWSYHGHQEGRIASMTKMMLMFTAYALVDSGAISLFDTVEVTDVAPLMGGSQAYLDRGERYTVSQLLSAIAVCSANDAAYLLAEHIGNLHDSTGVPGGVRLMNHFAKRIGLIRSKFYNAHGLPPARSWSRVLENGIAIQRYKRRDMVVATQANTSTPIEMAKLGSAICSYPRLLLYSNIMRADFWDADSARVFGPYAMNNHFKPVERLDIDGIKTGYTSGAGYCVTASAKRRGRRLIAVVFEANSQDVRDDFVIKILETAFDSLGIPPDTIAQPDTTTESEGEIGG